MKKIKPNEEFSMNGAVFYYEVTEENKIKLVKVVDKKIKKTTPSVYPTESEVVKFFLENNQNEERAKKAYRHYTEDGADWKDSRGNKVKNWKQKMRTNWFEENTIAPQSNQESKFVM